jgi:hypothetical protein
MDANLLTYALVAVLLAVTYRMIYKAVIFPYLLSKKLLQPLPLPKWLWGDWLALYKRACLSDRRPLTWWYVFYAIRILIVLMLIRGFYLLLLR